MATPSIELIEGVTHPTRDGAALLAADVFRPAKPGRYPTIVMRTPYDRRWAQTNNYAPPHWFAERGFVVVVQDVRGRGTSTGEFYPFAHEADDGEDCIYWAAGLPYSNGAVAMYGLSYPGATQLQAARRAPEPLVSIAPAMTSADYHEGWTYRGGALELAFAKSWAEMLAMATALRLGRNDQYRSLAASYAASDYSYLPLTSLQPLRESGLAPYFFDWLDHPDRDGYWRKWSLRESYSTMTAAALHVGGWWDIFLSGTLTNFAGMSRAAGTGEQYCVVGPWTHAIDESQNHRPGLGGVVANPLDDLLLDWFDHTLRGATLQNDPAPVRLFVLRANRWLGLESWPPPGAVQQDWFLDSGGRANSDRGDGRLVDTPPSQSSPDRYVADPLAPVPSIGGASCCTNLIAPMGPAPQAPVETLNGVLVYTSEPVSETVLIAGPVSAVVYAATSARDTDIVCRLCIVDRAGRSVAVSDGILRGRYRKGLDKQTPTTPHEVNEYRIELQPTCVEIRAGERIRLQVTSSAFPRWDVNTHTGRVIATDEPSDAVVAMQEVIHDQTCPSRLIITVLP